LNIPDFDPERHAFVEMGGKARLPKFQGHLQCIGQEVWVLADLDFLWDGAGSVLGGDPEPVQLCERAERLIVDANPELENPTTDQLKRQKKLAKFHCLRTDRELMRLKEALITKLRGRRIFVLKEGEMEEYVGLSESSKSKYLDAALEIVQGTRDIRFQDELAEVFASFVG
jgi:hypothetical protein